MDNPTKLNVFLWTLYDFANSFAYIAFFFYYSQWVVIDQHVPDIWFNFCFVVASLFLLVTAPVVGHRLDRGLSNLLGLRLVSLAIILSYVGALWLAATELIVWSLILFTVGFYFFILSFVFYTPLLTHISTTQNRGLISGIGLTGNYLGIIAGLLLALPLATGAVTFFGIDLRLEPIAPGLLLFFIFALPMLLFFKEKNGPMSSTTDAAEPVLRRTIALFSVRNISLFVFAFILFQGAVQTISNNFPIVLEQIWHITDSVKSLILIAVIVCSAAGSIIAGRLLDHHGWKQVAIGILIGWSLVLLLSATAKTLTPFILFTLVAGALVGATSTVARAAMSHLLPADTQNFGFSYFTIFERASTIITPLVWGLIVSGLSDLGSLQYRIAIASMALFMIASIFVLLKIRQTDEPAPVYSASRR